MRRTPTFPGLGAMAALAILLLGAAPVHAGGGACCLFEECVDTATEDDCNALGGFFLAGESCADDACGVGACCFEMTCNETDAFSCIAAGREFGGAGTTCLDDPCEAGVGSCCFADDSCADLDPDSCAAMGGTWLGAGTNCGTGPCDRGACCLPGDQCVDAIRHECLDLEGEFIAGPACADDPCSPDDCPEPNLFGQMHDGPNDDFLAGTSEVAAGFQRYENFFGVAGPIDGLVWHGLDLEFVGGVFIECEELDPTFIISFHEDAGGVPGDEVCSYTLLATRTPLGVAYNGAELNEYAVSLPQTCTLVNGWVSITGFGDADCWFLWMSAGVGFSWCDGCGVPQESVDLAICLQGTAGGVFGACCNDADGSCMDGVEISDCTAPWLRFEPDTTCADLDPPCGVVFGACCLGDGTCSTETESSCDALGGDWLGGNAPCSQCPCVLPCPPGGLTEGEAVCFDDYVDTFNGGCFSEPPVFSSIAPGDVICGLSGIFLDGAEPMPDIDMYELVLDRTTSVTVGLTAEFVSRLELLDAALGCEADPLAIGAAFECDDVTISGSLDAGTYWILVRPQTFDDTSGCGTRYTLDLTGATCPADISGDGEVEVLDLLFVLGAWGPCPGCAEDINGDGAVDVEDLLAVLGGWGPCP